MVASGLLGFAAVAARLTTVAVLALLARGAGAGAVGYYGLATLSASLVAAALSLGLPTYLTRELPAGMVERAAGARLHCLRLVVPVVAAVVAYPVARPLLPATVAVGWLLFFGASLLDQWNETAWALVRGTRSAWLEPLTTTATGLLLVTACGADAWLRHGLTFEAAAGYTMAVAALRSAVAFGVTGVWRYLRVTGSTRLGTHVRRAVPYLASDLLGLLYFRGDVLVLAAFVSAGETGWYVAAAAVAGPAVQVAAAMSTGALAYAAPRAAGPTQSTTTEAVRVFAFFRTAGFAATGLLCCALPIATVVLFGRYGTPVLRLATVLALFLALRFGNFGLSALLLAQGQAVRRLVVLAVSITANVALNLALDGPLGATGATWATVLTELVVTASLLAYLRISALWGPVAAAAAWVAAGAVTVAVLPSHLGATATALATGGLFFAAAAWRPRGRHREEADADGDRRVVRVR
jgi:O-antigen/teichoic acid export membrane protein